MSSAIQQLKDIARHQQAEIASLRNIIRTKDDEIELYSGAIDIAHKELMPLRVAWDEHKAWLASDLKGSVNDWIRIAQTSSAKLDAIFEAVRNVNPHDDVIDVATILTILES